MAGIAVMSMPGWSYAHPEVEFYSEVAARMEGAETVSRGLDELRRFLGRLARGLESDRSRSRRPATSATPFSFLGGFDARGEGSGVNLEQPVAYVFEFEDGLARRVRGYLDPQQALEAVGLRA